jgi:hypothetical protein
MMHEIVDGLDAPGAPDAMPHTLVGDAVGGQDAYHPHGPPLAQLMQQPPGDLPHAPPQLAQPAAPDGPQQLAQPQAPAAPSVTVNIIIPCELYDQTARRIDRKNWSLTTETFTWQKLE